MTYIALLQSTLPKSKELQDYEMKLSIAAQGELIEKAGFEKAEAWFDSIEASKQRPGADIFERPKHIKQILFELNKLPDKVYYFRFYNI